VLFPFMGFVLGCIAFSILGTLVLVLDPRLRWSIGNVMIFIVGAFAGVVGYSITYYCLVGDQPMDSAAAALSAIFTFALLSELARYNRRGQSRLSMKYEQINQAGSSFERYEEGGAGH
jgi:hypothetical protein